jgi:formyl-CoA transferase
LCKVLGVEPLVKDPRFSSNAQRNVNRAGLIALLEEKLATRDAADWVDALVEAGIPAGPINFPDETLTDEHVLARRMVVELEHPLIGSFARSRRRSTSRPTARPIAAIPPRLGEHNAELRALADQW